MSFMTWTHDLDTGINKVDDEHQLIVARTNDLHDVYTAGGSKEDCVKAIDALAKTAIDHFRDEEAMMQKAGYEYFDLHKGVHERFVAKLGELKGRYENGLDTPEPILEMMDNWLYSHIKNNDRGYVPTVKAAA